MIERTLSIIKPDGVERRLIQQINEILFKRRLEVVKQILLVIPKNQAIELYEQHKIGSYFDRLIEYTISGPSMVQIIEGNHAVAVNIRIIGSADPLRAAQGTIRQLYGIDCPRNTVHGSDSITAAEREIGLFFGEVK